MVTIAPLPSEPDPAETTLALLARAEGGDPAAWARLIHRCGNRLRVLLHYRLDAQLTGADPEDVLQETWAQAIHSFASFEYRGEGSFQRWLAGILRHKMLEFRRGARRRPAQIRGECASRGSAPAALFDALVDTQTPSRNMWQRERVRRVQEVLDRLPDVERNALLARYYEGLTLREAGDRAGVDPATILHRERRGLARCARALAASDSDRSG